MFWEINGRKRKLTLTEVIDSTDKCKLVFADSRGFIRYRNERRINAQYLVFNIRRLEYVELSKDPGIKEKEFVVDVTPNIVRDIFPMLTEWTEQVTLNIPH